MYRRGSAFRSIDIGTYKSRIEEQLARKRDEYALKIEEYCALKRRSPIMPGGAVSITVGSNYGTIQTGDYASANIAITLGPE